MGTVIQRNNTFNMTRNLGAAQTAFLQNNIQASRASHNNIGQQVICEPAHNTAFIKKEFLKKYGQSSSITGASTILVFTLFLSTSYALRIPFSLFLQVSTIALVVGSFFVGVLRYLYHRQDSDMMTWERDRETWEVDNYLEGEQKEMVELYQYRGMSRDDAEHVISIISKYKEFFVDVMMVEELGLMPPTGTAEEEGIVTFLSGFGYGGLSLLPALMYAVFNGWVDAPMTSFVFYSCSFVASLIIFGLGVLKANFVVGAWWKPAVLNLLLQVSLSFVTLWMNCIFSSAR